MSLSKLKKSFILFYTGALLCLPFVPVAAFAQSFCLCKPITTNVEVDDPQQIDPNCVEINNESECASDSEKKCTVYPDSATCEADKQTQAAVVAGTGTGGGQGTGVKNGSIVGAVIPSCLLEPNLSPDCRDVTVFIDLLINVANWAFGVIGAVALLVFVYGGFMLIISNGNSEKVQQGVSILTAAVVGLFVAFAGYILIQFIGTSLDVKSVYQLK